MRLEPGTLLNTLLLMCTTNACISERFVLKWLVINV